MRPYLVALAGLFLAACQKENAVSTGPIEKIEAPAEAGVVQAKKAPPCAAVLEKPRLAPLSASDTGGTLSLARAEGHTIALVADEDDSALVMVDVDAHTTLGMTPLAGKPSKLVVLPDGRVVVALADKSALEVLEPETERPFPLTRRCLVDTPAEPVGLAVTPDQTTLLVVSRWGHALSSLHLADLSQKATVELGRDPVTVLPSKDGKRAFVTHAAGGALSVVELEEQAQNARAVPVGNTHFTQASIGMMPPPKITGISSMPMKKRRPPQSVRHVRTGTQAFSMVRGEKGTILAPLVMVEPNPPKGSASGYGSASSEAPPVIGEIAKIDESTGDISLTASPQSIGPTDCFLPRAAALDEARGELWVACLGIDAIVTYDARKKHPHAYEKRRVRVPAGPTGIAIDPEGKRAVVFSQFAGAVTIVPLAEEKKKNHAEEAIPVSIHWDGRKGLAPELALGRALFHAAGKRRVSMDGRACASCHPDGRDDGMTWTTQEGPRQTPIIMGRLEGSAPFGWLGDAKDIPTHFKRTLARLAGTGLSGEERDAIFAWVNSLRPPREKTSEPEAKIARGKVIFESEEAACASCHQGESTTDGDKHDVASAARLEVQRNFETPSLRFVARSAPYFHDGRYATLVDMLKGADGTMGKVGHLPPEDVEALAAYVSSL